MSPHAKALFVAAALVVAASSSASAAQGLDCMAQSYGPEEQAEIKALSTSFNFGGDGGSSGDRLSEIGIAAVYECFERNEWSDEQLYYATLFELGRLSEAAYRASGHLTAEQLGMLDAALAELDRPELWAVMEKAVQAGIEDREAETTPQEDILMGGFIISLNIGSPEAVGEKVGELMGTLALQRIGRREFDALRGEK